MVTKYHLICHRLKSRDGRGVSATERVDLELGTELKVFKFYAKYRDWVLDLSLTRLLRNTSLLQ